MENISSLPKAFILTGAFWTICRNSLYLRELAKRDLKILVITPDRYRQQAEQKRTNNKNSVSLIDDIAYVEGDLDKEASFNSSVVAKVQRWRKHYHIIGALAVGETLVEPTGILADALNVKSPGLRATRVCRSKYLQRFYLDGLSPRSVIVSPGQRGKICIEEIPYPSVLKPATRHSSSGVICVENAKQARRVLLDYPDYETLLFEEKIIGQEYSVETLLQNGEILFSSVTHKITTDTYSNTFVELIHTVPCELADNDILINAAEHILKQLAFHDGIAHSEWRIDKEGKPYLMEIASRTPGDGILPLYKLACGQSMETVILKIMLGERADYPKPTRVARQVYLEHEPGILKDIHLNWTGVEVTWLDDSATWPDIPAGDPDDSPALRAVFVHKKKGDHLQPLRSSEDRAVAFFIDAKSIEELDQIELKVKQSITLEIEPYGV